MGTSNRVVDLVRFMASKQIVIVYFNFRRTKARSFSFKYCTINSPDFDTIRGAKIWHPPKTVKDIKLMISGKCVDLCSLKMVSLG